MTDCGDKKDSKDKDEKKIESAYTFIAVVIFADIIAFSI